MSVGGDELKRCFLQLQLLSDQLLPHRGAVDYLIHVRKKHTTPYPY